MVKVTTWNGGVNPRYDTWPVKDLLGPRSQVRALVANEKACAAMPGDKSVVMQGPELGIYGQVIAGDRPVRSIHPNLEDWAATLEDGSVHTCSSLPKCLGFSGQARSDQSVVPR